MKEGTTDYLNIFLDIDKNFGVIFMCPKNQSVETIFFDKIQVVRQ